MKEAGIREARQNLSALIADVKLGREIIITDRGRAVARLVPPDAGVRARGARFVRLPPSNARPGAAVVWVDRG